MGAEMFPTKLNLLVARSHDFGELEFAKHYAFEGMKSCHWFYPSLWSNLAAVFEAEGDHVRANFCRQALNRSPWGTKPK